MPPLSRSVGLRRCQAVELRNSFHSASIPSKCSQQEKLLCKHQRNVGGGAESEWGESEGQGRRGGCIYRSVRGYASLWRDASTAMDMR